ncbi:MAG TPA: tripartite tricarboxylate transporter permease [Stellaceae bacterium]|nr:tripartite tricarboxylate transporter permease [Stellaceae bacterium]
MHYDILHSAGHAFLIILDPTRLGLLFGGVCMGLALGILPGIGGVAGMALLLPFTYHMDPNAAFALLLGLGSTTTTADPISAIVLGAPGHAASAATVLDGFPMTKQGIGGRALGASYMSALMGGLFGALLMALAIPLLRPIILYMGSPELLAFSLLGMAMVAVLSGNTPLRGLTAACFGVMISMIGSDPQTGTLRWTMDSLYLSDGLPLVPATLGLYALPELCDLAVSRSSIAAEGLKVDTRTGLLQGARDCFSNWFLVLRCSWIGAGLGTIPGIGGSVIDWVSYGHALRTEKGATQSFGTGDVRGVIAAESASNAKEGGNLVPTVAFGVPGTAGMAILLGAFLIQGLVPGPEMLTKNLDLTYSMVWSIAIANVLGSGLCFLFSGQFAKLATLRYTLIMPAVLGLVYVGAFEGTRQWGDLFALLFFGLLGWSMKHAKWPRPPLILGLILGSTLERYLFVSTERYGWGGWVTRPVVLIILGVALLGLVRSFVADIRQHGGFKGMAQGFAHPRFQPGNLFPAFLLCLMGVMVAQATQWNFNAKIGPLSVGFAGLLFCAVSFVNEVFRRKAMKPATVGAAAAPISEIEATTGKSVKGQEGKIHMDIPSALAHLPGRTVLFRGLIFFGWMVGFMGSMALIGLIPTVPIFIIAYMRLEGRERWSLVLPFAVIMAVFIYAVFDQLLAVPWPPTVLGAVFPDLRGYVPSL